MVDVDGKNHGRLPLPARDRARHATGDVRQRHQGFRRVFDFVKRRVPRLNRNAGWDAPGSSRSVFRIEDVRQPLWLLGRVFRERSAIIIRVRP